MIAIIFNAKSPMIFRIIMTIYLPVNTYDLEQWWQTALLMSRVALELNHHSFQEATVLPHQSFFYWESQITSFAAIPEVGSRCRCSNKTKMIKTNHNIQMQIKAVIEYGNKIPIINSEVKKIAMLNKLD